MEKKIYRIETMDGVVVRKTATRPYVAGLIFRETDGSVRKGNVHIEFTTQPKQPIGSIKRWEQWNEQATYEQLVAIPMGEEK